MEKVVLGILAALGNDPKPDDLVDSFRSDVVQDMKLSEEDCKILAVHMIWLGFKGDAELFLLTLFNHMQRRPAVIEEQIALARAAVLAAVDIIRDGLANSNRSFGTQTLEALRRARNVFPGDRGKIDQSLRLCAEKLSVRDVDGFISTMASHETQVQEVLIEGMNRHIGLVTVWEMIRERCLSDPSLS